MVKKQKKIKKARVEVLAPVRTSSSGVLQRYILEISKFPILTREEEKEYSRLYYEKKDPEALKILIQSNLRFVVKIASQYNRFGSKLIDLVQEGNMGLLKAVKEFNPYRGVRLITYAVWWIRGAIQEYLMRQHSIVRIGTTSQQKKLFYQLRREGLPDMGKELPQITDQMKVSKEDVDSMRQRVFSRDVSLDEPGSGFESIAEEGLEDQTDREQKMRLIQKTVSKLEPSLNEKEKYVLSKRVLSSEPQTLQEIGLHFKMTREAVRQIESKLIQKIKEKIKNQIPL